MKIEGILARINENGRIVIPAVIRKGMGLKLGDVVVMSLDDDILRIEPQRQRARRVQENPRHLNPDQRGVPDHPAADRREEMRNEMDDWLG